jgi:rhodanese-related sulfurtransferase
VVDIMTIPTPSLGDRSYLVTDGATAFVVDPQRDIDRVLALAAGRGVFEYGDSLVANLGWLLPPGIPLTLIGDSPGQVADAQRDLARIGIDRLAGMAGPPPERRGAARRLASYPVSDFEGLAAARRDRPVAVLDVRRRLEWSGGHIEDALHVPLHHLPGRLPGLPAGPIWVHCQAGYRASVAASILHAAGKAVTAIDDDFSHAALAGLPLTTAPPPAIYATT